MPCITRWRSLFSLLHSTLTLSHLLIFTPTFSLICCTPHWQSLSFPALYNDIVYRLLAVSSPAFYTDTPLSSCISYLACRNNLWNYLRTGTQAPWSFCSALYYCLSHTHTHTHTLQSCTHTHTQTTVSHIHTLYCLTHRDCLTHTTVPSTNTFTLTMWCNFTKKQLFFVSYKSSKHVFGSLNFSTDPHPPSPLCYEPQIHTVAHMYMTVFHNNKKIVTEMSSFVFFFLSLLKHQHLYTSNSQPTRLT